MGSSSTFGVCGRGVGCSRVGLCIRTRVGGDGVGGRGSRVPGERVRVSGDGEGRGRACGVGVVTNRHGGWLTGLIGGRRAGRVGNRRIQRRGGTC